MKSRLLFLLIAPFILFTACEKNHMDKDQCKMKCGKECIPCDGEEYEDPAKIKEGVTKYVLEPVVFSKSCGCIVSGVVKYVKGDQTVAIVKYGDGSCDNYGIKVLCVDGDCDSKKAKVCKFKMKCKPASSETGN